ncbi:hypothetical protein K1T71_011727 [Dendrolimus kikuchii]|uniref:Uncharacterized protein n=1 Tax=Dendrolimus kikuchii TaxID=765133 RepID=A0ACC1CM38_9NEOP|nr:hypothetical protein K1T71_011727 [Dendrolimus kikuchii]
MNPISESDSDDDELLLLLLLKTRLMNKNKLCIHKRSRAGEETGEYQRMCIELRSNEDRFFDYFHMSKADFEELHELLSLQMKKYTCWTHITCLRERLAVCLRHLITGDSYLKIGNSFHMRGSTVGNIVARLWTSIAADLGESCDTVRKKWKTVRDGYIKYKNHLKDNEWSDRKTPNYVWASQLSFLDHETLPSNESVYKLCEISQIKSGENVVLINASSIPSNTVIIPDHMTATNPATETVANYSYNPISSPSTSSKPLVRKRKLTEHDVDTMILNFLERKNKQRDHDSVDYLFLSYARTFKKLSLQRQAMLKVELARLFSQAELSDIGITGNCIQPLPQEAPDVSPGHSRMSSASDSSVDTLSDNNAPETVVNKSEMKQEFYDDFTIES